MSGPCFDETRTRAWKGYGTHDEAYRARGQEPPGCGGTLRPTGGRVDHFGAPGGPVLTDRPMLMQCSGCWGLVAYDRESIRLDLRVNDPAQVEAMRERKRRLERQEAAPCEATTEGAKTR